ncbi:hypothetical protein BDN70DRAFT_887965 [Pholiota conissans]|uniref:Uncharacterized protein n=1 Tax=Pholiota conissans TaxID=109636 RepID=A0A9P6CSZ1_9AGAR|nr:hypothetical protein BDN70DRAFT_887965 [Pholiota conissans]
MGALTEDTPCRLERRLSGYLCTAYASRKRKRNRKRRSVTRTATPIRLSNSIPFDSTPRAFKHTNSDPNSDLDLTSLLLTFRLSISASTSISTSTSTSKSASISTVLSGSKAQSSLLYLSPLFLGLFSL